MISDQAIIQNIRAAIDDCTSGIDEIPSLRFRITQGTSEKKMKKHISLSIIIACTLLLLGTMTALAAGVEDINAMLYKFWPEAARALRPLNLSFEQAGIRLDVISAVLDDNQLLINYSLTDLEEDRINKETTCLTTINIPGLNENSYSTEMLSFDSEKHQAIFADYIEYSSLPYSEYAGLNNLDKICFTIANLTCPKGTVINLGLTDLWSLINEHNYTAEAVPVPYNTFGTEWVSQDDNPTHWGMMEIPLVLNPANSIHIPITDNMELSGIGWIDGKAHIQIHISDESIRSEDSQSSAVLSRYLLHVSLYDLQENEITLSDENFSELYKDAPFFISGITWYKDNDIWIEKIFPIQPDEMEQFIISCEFTDMFTSAEELLGHEWSVSFPTNMIQAKQE